MTAIPRGGLNSKVLSINALLAVKTMLSARECFASNDWRSCIQNEIAKIGKKARAEFDRLNFSSKTCPDEARDYEYLRTAYFLTKADTQVALKLHKHLEARREVVAIDRMMFPAVEREHLMLASLPIGLHFSKTAYSSRNYVMQDSHEKDYRAAVAFFSKKAVPPKEQSSTRSLANSLKVLNPTQPHVSDFLKLCGDDLVSRSDETATKLCTDYLEAAPLSFALTALSESLKDIPEIENPQLAVIAEKVSTHPNGRLLSADIFKKIVQGARHERTFKDFRELFHYLKRLEQISLEDRKTLYEVFSARFPELRTAASAETSAPNAFKVTTTQEEKDRYVSVHIRQVDVLMANLLSSLPAEYVDIQRKKTPFFDLNYVYRVIGEPYGTSRNTTVPGKFAFEHRQLLYGYGNLDDYFDVFADYLKISNSPPPSHLRDIRGQIGFGEDDGTHFILPHLRQVPGYGERLYQLIFAPNRPIQPKSFYEFLDSHNPIVLTWINSLVGTKAEKVRRAQKIIDYYLQAQSLIVAQSGGESRRNYLGLNLLRILDQLGDAGYTYAHKIRAQVESGPQQIPSLQNARLAFLKERKVDAYISESGKDPLETLLDFPLETIESRKDLIEQIAQTLVSLGEPNLQNIKKVISSAVFTKEDHEGMELIKLVLPHLSAVLRVSDFDDYTTRGLAKKLTYLARQSRPFADSIANQLREIGQSLNQLNAQSESARSRAKTLVYLIGPLNLWEPFNQRFKAPDWIVIFDDIANILAQAPLSFDVHQFYSPESIPHPLLLALSKKTVDSRLFARHLYETYNAGSSWRFVSAGANLESLKRMESLIEAFYELVPADVMASLDPVQNGKQANEKLLIHSALQLRLALDAFVLNHDLNEENLKVLLGIARRHPFLRNHVYRAINLGRDDQP